MAKQVNYTDKETGANFPKAYFRINRIIFNRPNCKGVNVLYDGFVDEASSKANKKPIHTLTSIVNNIAITNATDIRALIYAQDTNKMFEKSIDV